MDDKKLNFNIKGKIQKEIQQGDIFWVDFSMSTGDKLKDVYPVVVLQSSAINKTNINTVVVVGISTNTKLAKIKGNVLLTNDIAQFCKTNCVVNVSQLITIPKENLKDKVGKLNQKYIDQIFEGIDFLFGRYGIKT